MSCIRTVFGSSEIAGRVDMEEGKKMLEMFHNFGYTDIDTAFMYAEGKCEVYLGNMKDDISNEFKYATKANPWDGKGLGAASVRMQLETSLRNLKRDQVDIFYLHMPDHKTPVAETLKTVNDLYQEGKFKEFGLSNYSSCLVVEIIELCKQNGWVVPTVYEGMYSVLTRMVEQDLFPCLRHYGLRFYGYSPLGGGVLTGKHKIENLPNDEPGRFFGKGSWAAGYRNRYWKKEYFDAVEAIQEVLKSVYGEGMVSVAEAAYRWLYHHSALKAEHGDGVIVGASTVTQLEKNLSYTIKGPLHEKVVTVFDNIWKTTSHLCADYAK